MRNLEQRNVFKASLCRKGALLAILMGLTLAFSAIAVLRHFLNRTYSEAVRIVIAGDGRADYPWNPPRIEDAEGINKVITGEIAGAVLKEHAQLLLWTGDFANVPDNNPDTFRKQLRAWHQIIQPLYDHKVAVLPVRGNHEVYRYEQGSYDPIPILDAKNIWNEVFSGQYALPSNGPESEKNLSFYYVRDNVLCIGLDQYEKSSAHLINQIWLDDVFKNHKQPFVFVYGHEPAFISGSHGVDDTLGANPLARNALWESLMQAGALTYFCGHDHLYDHIMIVRSNSAAGPAIHQFTAGTAGGPFYHGRNHNPNDSEWKIERVKHIEDTYGYILVTITKNKAVITFKGRTAPGHYEPMDAWRYSVPTR